MQKIGVAGSTSFPEGKGSADIFEMIAGAFYKETTANGSEYDFHTWFDDTFTPLIYAADAAVRGYNE